MKTNAYKRIFPLFNHDAAKWNNHGEMREGALPADQAAWLGNLREVLSVKPIPE
jgi:hypothetical protein